MFNYSLFDNVPKIFKFTLIRLFLNSVCVNIVCYQSFFFFGKLIWNKLKLKTIKLLIL